MPKTTLIIPARWGSTRFPGKPLHLIAGKPLVQHVWERCTAISGVDRIIVATDDTRILEAAFAFGAEVALTSAKHPSGTDRLAEVAKNLPAGEMILNVQGDEPFLDPRLAAKVIGALHADPSAQMSTAACPLAPEELDNPNAVKVVVARTGHALYFSRCPIPCDRDGDARPARLRHIGIYAYRRNFLLSLVKLRQTPLEKAEKLEQLRALEHGAKIRVVLTSATSPGIDTPADAEAAERQLAGRKKSSRKAFDKK